MENDANKKLAEMELLERIQFIKQIKIFAALSAPQLKNIAENLECLSIQANTVIFKEGEQGDKCYFVVDGEVTITSEIDSQIIELAKLKKGSIFGEASILLNAPRSATATTISNTLLFVMQDKDFKEVVHQKGKPSREIIKLLQSRSRPRQNPAILVHQRKNNDNEDIHLLKNPETGEITEISAEAFALWQTFDGKRSLAEITENFIKQYPDFNLHDVAAMAISLAEDQFIFIKGYDVALENKQSIYPWWLRLIQKIPQLAEKFIIKENIDSWITKTYSYFKWCFHSITITILTCFLVIGLMLFFLESAAALSLLHTIQLSSLGWLYPAFFASVFIHEFSHAYLTKHFGYKVRAMGFGWFWIGPAAFCDTTDSLLAEKPKRLAINLVGVFTETAIAGLVCILSFVFRENPLSAVGWLYTLLIYINTIRNLDPIIDVDGYYTLQDLTNEPDIREKAVLLLMNFREAWQKTNFWRKNSPALIFWGYTIVFHVIILPFLVWVQFHLLGGISTIFKNIYLALGIPLLVVFLSISNVWAEIRAFRTTSAESE